MGEIRPVTRTRLQGGADSDEQRSERRFEHKIRLDSKSQNNLRHAPGTIHRFWSSGASYELLRGSKKVGTPLPAMPPVRWARIFDFFLSSIRDVDLFKESPLNIALS